jgi:transposase
MAPNLPAWKTTRINQILDNGIDVGLRALAKEFGTAYKTICQRKRALESQISPSNRRGAPPVITDDMSEYIISLLEREPELYQDELAAYLYEAYEVLLAANQVSKALSRFKHTKQVLKVSTAQRNDELIAAWRRKMVFWEARHLCFVDESACNERTTNRRRGWAPRGSPAEIQRILKSSRR